jgi:acetyl esterase/lipase
MNPLGMEKQTLTYKSIAGASLLADVYTLPSSLPRPLLIWIHGGCLMYGDRNQIRGYQLERYLDLGFNVVSIDYRLAPENKLPLIIEDLQEAYTWAVSEGPKFFGADGERVAVAGGSAGGYLAQMTGFCVEPRPKALISFYGYGDIIEDWYSKPDPFYCQQPAVSEEEAHKNRGLFYLYCRQTGRWPIEVGGHDPVVEPQWFDPYCPAHNVTAEYPPTVLIHGVLDTDVPYSQSVQMDQELTAHNVAHEFITLPHLGHGFGLKPEDPPSADEIAVMDQVAAFLSKHVL